MSTAGTTKTPRTGERVLVTGGAGFIGSHVVEVLLVEGADVTVLDDLSTGREENLPSSDRLRLVRGDASDLAVVRDALAGCTRVVHLAAIASVDASVKDPIGTHQVNMLATLNVLEASREAGVERVVYASSAAVYGDVREPPVVEEGVLDPRSPYAIDKLAGEHFVRHYRHAHGLSAIALRFFNVYGVRQRADSPYSGVISLFVDRVMTGRPVTIDGDGAQTRDFVEVGDVANAVTKCLRQGTLLQHEVMNVGTGVATSVIDLLGAVEATVGRTVDRTHGPERLGDVRRSMADVARLTEAIDGWAPCSLREGLAGLVGAHQLAHGPRGR